MFHWFRRFLPNQLLASTSDVSEALRAASQYADSTDIRLEYTAAADALDRAIAHAKRYGNKSERDAVTYALGRAQINVRAQLTELIEVSKETHMIVQDVQSAQTEQGAAVGGLRAEFQTFGADMSGRLSGVEERMGQSEADRQQLHAQNDRLEQKFDQLEGEVREALDQALGPARVAELIDMIERHERVLKQHEAGS